MESLRRFFRRLGKGLKAKGYTLIEVAAVVAVTGTLAAVVVPIAVDKTNEGKLAAAKQDCVQIGNAIAGFYKDVGFWPAYDGTDSPTAASLVILEVLRSGSETAVLGGATTHDPINAATMWTGVGASTTKIDILENHLVKDNPKGDADGYREANFNWKGPYIGSLASKRDPWGNNYLVYVKAMHTASTGDATKQYGWIISAGPNGILETAITAKDLAEDDIGVMLYASETGK